MQNLSRRVRRLRRKVYRQTPVATSSRIAELDHRMSYADMTAALGLGNFGVPSAGAALALWRVCSDRDLRAWCYEFGFPESLTHTVTIVEIDGILEVHDAFFNLSYRLGLYDTLDSLLDGNTVKCKCGVRDRKIYIVDPACERQRTVRWLEANADRELEPVEGLRRFELLWNPEAFTATCADIDGVSRDLAIHGYPGDLQFLMLHPVAVFDGEGHHRDRTIMPLVGGRDLQSPVAALRVATRDLETERSLGAQSSATIARLEAELAHANSRLSAASQHLSGEREGWLQQKVALQAGTSALEGELAKTRTRLAAAVDLRAQRDSQIAQLRAEIEDATQQFESQRKALVALEGQRQEWEAARLCLEGQSCDLQTRLEAGSRENEQLREHTVLLESRADEAQGHAIEVAHYIAPLLEEMDQLRRDYRSVVQEREAASGDKARLEAEVRDAITRADSLEAKIAATTGARLAALWRRFARKWEPPFRAGPPKRFRG